MGKMHAEGVTLIELMVTLAVVAVLLAVGIPAVRNLVSTNVMSSAVNELVSSLHLARSEALKTGASVSICASTNWNSESPTCSGDDMNDGWIVFVDNVADNNAVDDGEVIMLKHAQLPDSVILTAPQVVSFSASGVLENQLLGDVDFLLCDGRGDHDTGGGIAAGRRVELSRTGRPRILSGMSQVACDS